MSRLSDLYYSSLSSGGIKDIKITARATFDSAKFHGDLLSIIDNELKYLDLERFSSLKLLDDKNV